MYHYVHCTMHVFSYTDVTMKLILVATLLAMATVVASKPLTDGDVEKEWKGFLGKFNKNYQNAAHQSRRYWTATSDVLFNIPLTHSVHLVNYYYY